MNVKQRKTLHDLVPNAGSDAIDLMTKLLHLNPDKRITATEALEHPYVAKFHNLADEVELDYDVVPPVDDDVQLSVDEYRQKLYEMIVQKIVEIKKRSSRISNSTTPSNTTSSNGRAPSGRTNSSKNSEHKNSADSIVQRKNSLPSSFGDVESHHVTAAMNGGSAKYSSSNGYSHSTGITSHPTKGYDYSKPYDKYEYQSMPSQKPPIAQLSRTTHTAPSDRKQLKPLNPRRFVCF